MLLHLQQFRKIRESIKIRRNTGPNARHILKMRVMCVMQIKKTYFSIFKAHFKDIPPPPKQHVNLKFLECEYTK